MYNMLMTCEEDAWERREWSIELSRFLEYTSEPIAQYFKPLNNEIVAKLLEMPTLFTYEGGGTAPSRVGKITKITRSLRELRIQWEPYAGIPPILPNVIYDLFSRLDIDLGWESSRTHWAIKEVDLLQVLRDSNITPFVEPSTQMGFSPTRSSFTPGVPYVNPQDIESPYILFGTHSTPLVQPNLPYFLPIASITTVATQEQLFVTPIRVQASIATLQPPFTPSPPHPPPGPVCAPVKVFISYSWDSKEHQEWVEGLAKCLRSEHGIDATMDTWDVCGGQDLSVYMENSIRSADRVLMIYTESAVSKAAARSGGLGYEHMIVTAEIMKNMGTSKFIPVVRQASRPYSLPPQFMNRLFYDLGYGQDFASELEKLVKELLNIRPIRPPLGRSPYQKI